MSAKPKKPCPYCGKQVPTNGLANHMRFCSKNPDRVEPTEQEAEEEEVIEQEADNVTADASTNDSDELETSTDDEGDNEEGTTEPEPEPEPEDVDELVTVVVNQTMHPVIGAVRYHFTEGIPVLVPPEVKRVLMRANCLKAL